MSTAILAPLQPAHWPHLAALLTQAGLPLDGLAHHPETTLVALDGSAVIGCVALELYGSVALLRSLAVAPDRRSHGLGTQLVDAALDLARQRDVRTLYLLTETATPYFARRGFVPVSRSAVDPALHASAEFSGACPASAQAMQRSLLPSPPTTPIPVGATARA